MAGERPEYRVLRPIPDPTNMGRTAYLPGEGIYAQVVDDWHLVEGEDVESARPNAFERPAGNASRDAWARYRLSEGRLTQQEVDGMGRDELRDFDTETADSAADQPAVAKGE
jgi:hypothetical protein